ncbi:Hypothetical predicted protein [Cloeon dipterum]|uniref:Glucuronosyltransferase n=1 Tax=Cloeon dipterum TaxID=197152 RepID=A0A8S1D1U5_9INSE|nr:Hypothetical predicted protein [Cloeon dipterum]
MHTRLFILRPLAVMFVVMLMTKAELVAGGSKILAVTPMVSPSHGIWNRCLLEALVEKGHQVTVLSPFSAQNKTGISYYNIGGQFDASVTLSFAKLGVKEQTYQIWQRAFEISRVQVKSGVVKRFLVDREQRFDLIILEMHYSESFLSVLTGFGVPIVAINAFGDGQWNWQMIGAENYPSVFAQPVFSFRSSNVANLQMSVRDFVDSAEEGFIYMSLGTNVKSSLLPKETVNSIMQVLGNLKLKVLWKFEEDNLPGKPDNVMIRKWLSQQDILGHKNIRLFISHGGRLSIHEAVHHGVPLVVIPFYIDQHKNAETVVRIGMGVRVSYLDFTRDSFEGAIFNVLREESYKENALRASAVARDRVSSPLEEAVFWIEHVIRNNGSKYLQPASAHFTFIQLHSLDVIALLLAPRLRHSSSFLRCTKQSDSQVSVSSNHAAELVGANFNPLSQTEEGTLSRLFSMLGMFKKLCPTILNLPQIKPLLDEKFDLVIISTFFSQCFLPFGYINGAPMIGISAAGSLGMGMDMANPEPRSYVPNLFLPLTSKMTFAERVTNTFISHLISFLATFVHKPVMYNAAKEFFGPNIPTIEEMEKNLSLVIYNNHFTLNNPRPLNPGVIDAGGMHIKDINEKLPKDLQDFMDGAKDGVIYFSMGSYIKGSEFPEEKVAALLDAFSELPQRVIFKWETEEMPNKPNNVKIGKWLPQQAVLAHPNMKLFITHGGLLSTQEAAYHGVPLVGIPFFGDQQLNVAKSSRMGLAVGLDYNTLKKQTIINAIKTVINEPSFYKNAQVLKKRMRDQPESPLDRAVFWTEYVLRHSGAPHLRTAATDMSWWQVHLIDVYGAIFAE